MIILLTVLHWSDKQMYFKTIRKYNSSFMGLWVVCVFHIAFWDVFVKKENVCVYIVFILTSSENDMLIYQWYLNAVCVSFHVCCGYLLIQILC